MLVGATVADFYGTWVLELKYMSKSSFTNLNFIKDIRTINNKMNQLPKWGSVSQIRNGSPWSPSSLMVECIGVLTRQAPKSLILYWRWSTYFLWQREMPFLYFITPYWLSHNRLFFTWWPFFLFSLFYETWDYIIH